MITYTVFDPDDASHVAYRWYGDGDTTVYVYIDGGEDDSVELAADESRDVDAVAAWVERYHREHHAGRTSGPPPDAD